MPELTIATITWAREPNEAAILSRALKILASLKHPIVAADAGSDESFLEALRALEIKSVKPLAPGLVNQVKASLGEALASESSRILYTEPDKLPFFRSRLDEFIEEAATLPEPADMVFASRTKRSFHTFPEGQRNAERFMNEATANLLGKEMDYCYGPILLSRQAAELALKSPENLGWGWRFWLLARAVKENFSVSSIELPLPCPAEQRTEDTSADRIYRLKQLQQNLAGLTLGLAQ